MKDWIRIIFLLGLMGAGIFFGIGLKEYSGQIFIYYVSGQGPEKAAVERMAELEQEKGKLPPAAGWAVERNLEVCNSGLGVKHKADCMMVYGARELVLPGKLAEGGYGYFSERDSCMISRQLAMELFGAVQVTGKIVSCREQEFRIRGVFEDERPVILIPALEQDRLDYLLFDYGGDSKKAAGLEQILSAHGISREYVMLDGSIFWAGAGVFMIVPFWFLSLSFVCKQIKKLTGEGNCRLFLLLLCVIGITAAFGAGLKILEVKIPDSMIPTRWSEFSFWTGKFTELKEAVTMAGSSPFSLRGAVMLKKAGACLIIFLAEVLIKTFYKSSKMEYSFNRKKYTV